MNFKHVAVIVLLTWLVLSFMPMLLLPSLSSGLRSGRAGK